MPRTTKDRAFEQTTIERDFLPDLCTIIVYSWTYDAAGGRYASGTAVATYSNVPSRLEPQSGDVERTDAAGTRILADYNLKIGRSTAIEVSYFRPSGSSGYYIRIQLTNMNGVAVSRHFHFIAYLEGTEERLRTFAVREVF